MIKSSIKFGRIFAAQKPGYPLQFGRYTAKFRFYPLRSSVFARRLHFNHRFLV
jgi:hypothetical protein